MKKGWEAVEAMRKQAAMSFAAQVLTFALHVIKRFWADECLRVAASLSYTSLLALVPLIALGLSILTAFPAFEGVRLQLQEIIFENLLPNASEMASESLSSFIENAGSLTALGVLGLAVVAVMLLMTINDALSSIWRVTRHRPLALQILVYWTILTLGPLLIGTSLSLSSYAFALVEWSGMGVYARTPSELFRLITVPLSAIGFALLYFLVPNRSVSRSHAIVGGIVAAVLFELLKVGFGLYLKHFPSYQAIYGAASFVPIFLVWMYLSWAVVLLGAEIAAALPEWRAVFREDKGVRTASGLRLWIALAVLRRLFEASRGHKPMPKIAKLARGLAATPAEVDGVLSRLRKVGYVAPVGRDRWVLGRDPETLTLYDVAQAVDLTYQVGASHVDEGLQDVMAAIESAERDTMGASLKAIFLAAHDKEEAARLAAESTGDPDASKTVETLAARRAP